MMVLRKWLAGCLIGGILSFVVFGILHRSSASEPRMWQQLREEAEGLGLPTKFLREMPSDFVRFEFDDLQTFAAEYHLGEHRLVLNRSLSFNTAGATLRPLKRLTYKELETLYHELFHAYIDYLVTTADPIPHPIVAFARAQQHCHYGTVLITPIVQRKSETEERFLTERESWEALNETWALFVGWIVWNELDLTGGSAKSLLKSSKHRKEWLARLKNAESNHTFRGYYEPEDPVERGVTQKRFLAPASRLSRPEAKALLDDALGFPAQLVRDSLTIFTASSAPPIRANCE